MNPNRNRLYKKRSYVRKQQVANRLLRDIHIEQKAYGRKSYTFEEWYVLLATTDLNYAGRWHREWMGYWRRNHPVTE